MTTDFDLELTPARAEELALRAQEAFETAVCGLRAAVAVLKDVAEAGDREVMRDLKAMNAAYLYAMDIQEKARVAGSKRFGEAGAGTLDLDGARAEIDLRLACLRDARGGGAVPDGAE